MDSSMNEPFGIEGLTVGDRAAFTSRYSDVREAMFANPYQPIWGTPGQSPFARFPVTLGSVLRGLLSFGSSWAFLDAAKRAVASNADLRWGGDGKGYRRLLHPNGIGLTGLWEIGEETPYSGYFRKGSRGLVIGRYSTCCTETRRGHTRSLALAGRVYPTSDAGHPTPLPTACFITQQDIGGEDSASINEAVLRNAPNTTASRRGSGLPILLTTGIVFMFADKQPSARQVYQLAELGKANGEPTRAPEFMQLTVSPEQPVIPGEALDFRDEVMAQIYDRGDSLPKRKLVFRIETSDQGVTRGSALKQRREIADWRQIGTMTFDAAVASLNVDRVVHFNHPPWRDDRNDPSSAHVR
jgi:hypothetical protein